MLLRHLEKITGLSTTFLHKRTLSNRICVLSSNLCLCNKHPTFRTVTTTLSNKVSWKDYVDFPLASKLKRSTKKVSIEETLPDKQTAHNIIPPQTTSKKNTSTILLNKASLKDDIDFTPSTKRKRSTKKVSIEEPLNRQTANNIIPPQTTSKKNASTTLLNKASLKDDIDFTPSTKLKLNTKKVSIEETPNRQTTNNIIPPQTTSKKNSSTTLLNKASMKDDIDFTPSTKLKLNTKKVSIEETPNRQTANNIIPPQTTSEKNVSTTLLNKASSPSKGSTKKVSIEKPSPNRQTAHNIIPPQTTAKKTTINEEEVLEKFTGALSSDIHTKKRIYKNDLIRVIAKVEEANFSSKKQGLLMLRCCTDLLPDEPPSARMALYKQVWTALEPHTTFTVDHYNELLRINIANNQTIVANQFIQKMYPVIPDLTTYELLMKAIAQAGDLNQATELISNMKARDLPATESIFNSLIICQGKAGNPKNIQEVLIMMQSLKIERTSETYTAIAIALAVNMLGGQMLSEISTAYKSGIRFEEVHIMEIVKTLTECQMVEYIPKVLQFLPKETLQSPSISPYMQVVATHLVFRNLPMAALEIYKCLPTPSFGPKDDQGLHGRSLVRDCVKAAMPSSVIGLIASVLMASGRNPIALQNAAEAALQLGKGPLALEFFMRMKQLGLPIRCHYFWPILLQSANSFGEKGIMNTLKTMVDMEVPPDYETMMTYVCPYVSFTSPQNLMKKFLEANLTVTMALTPMMETLMNTGQLRAASEICELFHGKIDAEKLTKPLVKGFQISMDLTSTVLILEDIYRRPVDTSKDWVGRFFCEFLRRKRTKEDMNDLFKMIEILNFKKIKISTSAADNCLSHVPDKGTSTKFNSEQFREILAQVTDEKIVDEGEIFATQIPHPKHMNEENLQAHLKELEAKGMNTRGVLRKLLQEYCRTGNLSAARNIVEKCQKEGVFLSAGMKAAIFDLHVKMGELDMAELALADLNKTAPNFMLDEFKVIDFATLMVYRKRIDKAFNLINEQSKKRNVIGGRNISMNCWRLLDAVAANNSHVETRNMFELLTSLGYCEPTNVCLGPLIRAHLKYDNVVEAVNEFLRIAEKYNQTPLKHELLCEILESMNDGLSEDNFLSNERSNGWLNKLVQSILDVNKKIHGVSDVQLTLISALAEVGYSKTLRKMFLDPTVKFHPDALIRRCERFADEKKVHVLQTIVECGKGLRRFDVADVYDLILDVYQRNDEVDKALKLWSDMQDREITPTPKFIRNLCAMAKANNRHIPTVITSLNDEKMTNEQK